MKLLFVCTGNTCRSPMAEVICRERLTRMGLHGEVSSAGLSPNPGDVTNPLTLRVLADHGLASEPKPAVPLTPEMLLTSDCVAVMTEQHAALLAQLFPAVRERLRVLAVSDPFGGGLDEYEQCYRQLTAAIDRLLATLVASTEESSVKTSAPNTEMSGGAAETERDEKKSRE